MSTRLVRVDLVIQQVLFSVVGDLGPYNAIMGQAWLHSMKVVPSTYHQMVSYLTNDGLVDLLSNRLAARQCYLCGNKGGRRASKVLSSRIKPPRSNHSLPAISGRRRRIYWCGPLKKSNVGQAGEVHLCQFSSDGTVQIHIRLNQ